MNSKNKESIIVIQTGKLGDIILTTTLFTCLKKVFPECRLTVLASELGSVIPLNHPSVDEVLIYDKKVFNSAKLFFRLNQNFYDKWIDPKPEYSRTSSLLKRAGRFEKSYGFTTRGNNFDFDLNEISSPNHLTSLCLRPLAYISKDYDYSEEKPSIGIPRSSLNRVAEFIKSNPEPYLVFNTSSGKKERNWNLESLAEIYNQLKNHIRQVFIFSRKERHIYNFIKTKTGEIPEKFEGDFSDICALVKHSKAVLTPDTSIVHIASCFNKPVVGLYNNVKWNLERFAPLSERNIVLQSDSEDNIDINTEKIIKAVKEILQQA